MLYLVDSEWKPTDELQTIIQAFMAFFFPPTTLISQQYKLDPLIQITVRMAFKLYLHEPQYLGTTEKK